MTFVAGWRVWYREKDDGPSREAVLLRRVVSAEESGRLVRVLVIHRGDPRTNKGETTANCNSKHCDVADR